MPNRSGSRSRKLSYRPLTKTQQREIRLALRQHMPGGLSAIASALKLRRQAISKWQQVPPEHVLMVARVTGLSPHFLRPDLYPTDWATVAAE